MAKIIPFTGRHKNEDIPLATITLNITWDDQKKRVNVNEDGVFWFKFLTFEKEEMTNEANDLHAKIDTSIAQIAKIIAREYQKQTNH